MFKILLLLLLLFVKNIFAQIIATENIYYNQRVTKNNTKQIGNDNNIDIFNKKYLASHYIKKNSIIIKRDIKLMNTNRVTYRFGNFLEVEEYGKIITETNVYIKIKKPSGKIKKLFKNGAL